MGGKVVPPELLRVLTSTVCTEFRTTLTLLSLLLQLYIIVEEKKNFFEVCSAVRSWHLEI